MNNTIIGWTKVTWNPVHGCTRVSDGCRHCYAEQLSLRYGWTKQPWTKAHEGENVVLKPHKLSEPLKLKAPSKIFVNSMSDLFHPLVPDEYIARVFEVMNACPQHTFQILTKRPERAAAWPGPWAPHIWMGTSVEDARVAHRIETLRTCGAQVRFLSCEPLIGPLGQVDLTGIHWVIVGGESGKDFRPMPHAWAREIWEQTETIAFFFKQSAAPRTEMGTSMRHQDGSFWTWNQFPGEMHAPVPASPHRYTYEDLTNKAA